MVSRQCTWCRFAQEFYARDMAEDRDIVKSIVLFFLLAFSGNQPYFVAWRQNLLRAEKANEAYQKKLSAQ